jgi:glycolate oxidase iron-sulfur subunit
MRAVVEDRIAPADEAFRTHIDRCLGCRACEPVCPSGVQYGYLLERARAGIAHEVGTSPMARAMLATFANRGLSRIAWAGGRLLRAGGGAAAIARVMPPRFHTARFGLAMLAATRPWPGLRTAGRADLPPDTRRAPARGAGLRVGMLRGCVQDGLFQRVNRSTERVLRANGCVVVDVPSQGCCGALHAHSGHIDRARAMARRNVDAFEKEQLDRIVVNAAGCGAVMKEYGELLEGDPAYHARAAQLAARVRDVWELLAEIGPASGAPVRIRATYDAACHLHHAQRITRAPLDVIATIPGVDLVPLPRADECCGGAGIYGILHPELGGRILDDKVDAVRSTGAEVVLTSNPGCIMQIGAGLLLAGEATPVLHPMELLDESYRRAGGGG